MNDSKRAWSIHETTTMGAFFALAGILVFWGVRALYWSVTSELPFSDMADFERIAHGILERFSLEYTAFWKSYKSPTLPVAGALVWGVAGKYNYLAWRIFQAAITSAGLFWLAWELAKVAGRWLPSIILVWTIALSKPSIFWSYKYATEGIAEALIYLVAAALLFSVRKGSAWGLVGTGALVSASILNRPNYAVQAPCIVLILALHIFATESAADWNTRLRRLSLQTAAFGLGMAIVWMPWVARNYGLYGEILLTNTSGGHSLIFDLGRIEVTLPDGTEVNATNSELLSQAKKRFENDYQSHLHASAIFRAWLAQDPWRYLKLVRDRFFITLREHNVYLTRVSRTELFGNGLDSILLDKTPILVASGLLGLILLAFAFGSSALLFIPFVSVTPWLFAILVANTSRYLDPMVPLLSFGFTVLPVAAWAAWRRMQRSAPGPIIVVQGAGA